MAHWPLDDGKGEVAREAIGKGKPGCLSGAAWVTDGGYAARGEVMLAEVLHVLGLR